MSLIFSSHWDLSLLEAIASEGTQGRLVDTFGHGRAAALSCTILIKG